MRAIQRAFDALARRTDYYIMPGWRLRHWPMADHLRTIFARSRVSIVFDVGANVGQYRQFLREHVGWSGPIVSFDPVPANVEALNRAAAADPLWHIYPCALGRTPGSLPFKIMRSTALSSFHAPNHEGMSAAMMAESSVVTVVDVPVRTVAEVWPEIVDRYGPIRPHLKLDTQGYDLEVLAGAAPVVAEIATAQSEIAFMPLYHEAPTYHESLSAFADQGLAVTGMFPVSWEPDTLQVREFDCILVNTDRLQKP
jgi:FkbM family methyltransferase